MLKSLKVQKFFPTSWPKNCPQGTRNNISVLISKRFSPTFVNSRILESSGHFNAGEVRGMMDATKEKMFSGAMFICPKEQQAK